jgi:hypothetical protein
MWDANAFLLAASGTVCFPSFSAARPRPRRPVLCQRGVLLGVLRHTDLAAVHVSSLSRTMQGTRNISRGLQVLSTGPCSVQHACMLRQSVGRDNFQSPLLMKRARFYS